MMSGKILTRAQPLKTATALIALSILASCATTKAPAKVADQGAIGDADVPQVVYRNKGPYKDPLVTTAQNAGHAPAPAQASATHPANTSAPQTETVAEPERSALTPGGLFSAHAQPVAATEGNNSIVPSGLPGRSIQATVTSVYSLQNPQEQEAEMQPADPAPEAPAMQQSRRPSKAEILAGLAPDPSKRQNMQPMRQTGAPEQVVPNQIAPAMASQLSPAETAELQASIPTATPIAANSRAPSQMEQIEGAPQAKGMTRDSFIKKFLAKLRN